MLLALYKTLIAIHWIFALFLAFCLIIFVILMMLNTDSLSDRQLDLLKKQQALEREFPDGVPFKKTAFHTRVNIILISSFIYFMLIFSLLQSGLLVQTQCVIDKVDTNSKGVPQRIFVTYTAENKQYSEKARMWDTTIYDYISNVFAENSSKPCWYDRIDPSRVTLEPQDFIWDFENVVFSFVAFVVVMVIVQWAISKRNEQE